MNITAIISSHRKSGNTDQAAQLLLDSLQKQASEEGIPLVVETIHLAHHNLGMCRGCRICFDQGETQCPLKDDLLSILDGMQSAAAIIAASPVYVDDVNGVMKNWIDRMAFVCHRPQFAGKSAFLLATAGMAHSKHTLRTMGFAFRTWGFHLIGELSLIAGAKMEKKALIENYQQKIDRSAQQILQSLRRNRVRKPSFFALMTFRIQQAYWQKNRDDSIDYRYWKKQGWMDKNCHFYIPHSASALKVFLARLTGQVIGAFVK
jgi:multimeric flavodoxin WrbA